MPEPSDKQSIWIRIYQSGTWVEVISFVFFSFLGIIIAILMGMNNLFSLLIMSFGFPKVFWGTVHKLALEDGLWEDNSQDQI
jgi:hypothetical protein